MPLSADERNTIAGAFTEAMATIEEMFHVYARKAGAPERFAISVFDASDAGANYEASGDLASRKVAEHQIRTADWGDRNFSDNARNKVRASLRLNRDSGDIARNSPDQFQEGDMRSPGSCFGEVGGKRVCVATSGLRGTEDEPFAQLVIQLMQRLTPAA